MQEPCQNRALCVQDRAPLASRCFYGRCAPGMVNGLLRKGGIGKTVNGPLTIAGRSGTHGTSAVPNWNDGGCFQHWFKRKQAACKA